MSFTDGFFEWVYWINDGGLFKIFDQVNNVMPNGFGIFIAICLFCATIAIIVLLFILVAFVISLLNKWVWKNYLDYYCKSKK